jgi:hypothetical protein
MKNNLDMRKIAQEPIAKSHRLNKTENALVD